MTINHESGPLAELHRITAENVAKGGAIVEVPAPHVVNGWNLLRRAGSLREVPEHGDLPRWPARWAHLDRDGLPRLPDRKRRRLHLSLVGSALPLWRQGISGTY